MVSDAEELGWEIEKEFYDNGNYAIIVKKLKLSKSGKKKEKISEVKSNLENDDEIIKINNNQDNQDITENNNLLEKDNDDIEKTNSSISKDPNPNISTTDLRRKREEDSKR